MKEVILNNDVASPLVEKLTEDTLQKVIKWERMSIDNNVEIPTGREVPLTTARADYHFGAELADGVEAHFQRKNGLYFVWIEREDGAMAHFSSDLYNMPLFADKIIKLAKAIRTVTHDDNSILDDINAYLEI